MTTSADSISAGNEIVAGPGKSYRIRRYIMFVLLVAAGAWFWYDGYRGWPEHNRKLDVLEQERSAAEQVKDQAKYDDLSHQISRMHARYKDTDILLQKALAYSLPPLGIFLLLRTLYLSRGQFRLKDDTLFAPGHPPIPFTAIRELDKRQWDRKGIAVVKYEVDGRGGVVTIDDFLYAQTPTDAIY
ncbi:MAG TPA: hypothetical protein VL282_10145, partial [Tepidisphaeraceae bacterium]|nr:hypothetical protein [Tepidisphaeraceae bacterium]